MNRPGKKLSNTSEIRTQLVTTVNPSTGHKILCNCWFVKCVIGPNGYQGEIPAEFNMFNGPDDKIISYATVTTL